MDKRLKIYQNRDSSYDAIKGNKLLHYNWSFVTYKIYNIQLITIGPSYVPVGRLIHKPHIQMILQVQRSFDGSNESILNFQQFESLRNKMTPKSEEDIEKIFDGMSIDEVADICNNQGLKITNYLSIDKIKTLVKDKTPKEILFFACVNDLPELVQMAIEMGVDVNVRDKSIGWTALKMATTRGHIETADILIKNGADVNSKDNYGMTARMYASEKNEIEIKKLLKKYGAK